MLLLIYFSTFVIWLLKVLSSILGMIKNPCGIYKLSEQKIIC